MKKVFFIRHGESHHNFRGNAFSGLMDVSITDKGKERCTELSEELKNTPIDRIFVSPLSRAIETAELVFPKLSKDLTITDCLKEFDYGEYDGHPQSFFGENDPIIMQWNTNPGNLTFPGGGNIKDHAEHVLSCLTTLFEKSQENVIACVSHKTTLRLLFAQFLSIDLNHFRKVPCDNGSSTESIFENGKFELVNLDQKMSDILKAMRG